MKSSGRKQGDRNLKYPLIGQDTSVLPVYDGGPDTDFMVLDTPPRAVTVPTKHFTKLLQFMTPGTIATCCN